MQYKLLFVFAALLIGAQALTLSESIGVLYTINDKRYDELLVRMKESSFQRDILLKTTITAFAFNCKQVTALLATYSFDNQKAAALEILKANIVDPQNKATILDSIQNADAKKQATATLATVVACKTEGVAPEKFPFIVLPFKDQWDQVELENLIHQINKAPMSDKKLQIAEDALTSSTKVLTSEQACVLYESFAFSKDMLALTEFVKDRIVGLTCDQIISVLNRFAFEKDKLLALEAFKHNIIDVENKLTIVDCFVFTPNKEEARKILDGLRPKSYLFGLPTGKVAFALDTSGSMSAAFTLSNGQRMNRLEFVKKEFAKTVSTLEEATEFNVFPYSSAVRTWKTGGLQKATQSNIDDAIAYSKKFSADGGTNIYAALQTAWAIPGLETIYLLTDGAPSVGVTDTNKLLADIKTWYAKTPIKVNTIAFLMGTFSGDEKPKSRALMAAIAEATNGIYRAVESDK